MKTMNVRFREMMLAAALASSAALAACGGGGGSDSGAKLDTVSAPTFACSNVVGAIDVAQVQLTNALLPQLAAIPQAGPTVQTLAAAVIQLLDVVDVVTNGLQALAATQDPGQLTATVEGTVAALRCALAPVSESLAGLQAQLPAGANVPSIGNANALLQQLAELLDGKLGAGPGAGLPNGLDLAVVGSLLQQINAQLNVVVAQVSSQLPANTPISPVLTIATGALADVTLVLDRLAALDDVGTADAITFLVSDIAARLNTGLASSLNLPLASVLGPQNALTAALATVTAQLSGAVALILGQLHGVLVTVLGGLLGGLG